VTKSYSLPLWKRKTAEGGGGEGSELDSPSPIDVYVGLKVSVPRFTTKSVSPSRDDNLSRQLQPCLVQHNATADPSSTPTRVRPMRRTSLTLSHRHDHATVPLRPCCADCEAIWEQSRKEGDDWKEKFTKGARRRRNSSSDAPRALRYKQQQSNTRIGDVNMEFAKVLGIKVDEVDKRRYSNEAQIPLSDSAIADDEPEAIELAMDAASLTVPIREEDEDQLFPLPSPRRSPSASPIPSPSASSSSLALNGAKDTRPGSDAVVPKKPSLGNLKIPARPTSLSPPSPSLLRPISFSAPLPTRRITSASLHDNLAIADADAILRPSLSRLSPSTSPKSHSSRHSFAKAGSGLLKGVLSIGGPPLI